MKKLDVFGIAAVAAIGLLSTTTQAQEMNAEAIMKAHIKALGGMEAMDKVRTIKVGGSMSMYMGDELLGTFELVWVVGKKFYQKIDLGVLVSNSAWNGTVGWIDTGNRPRDLLHGEIGMFSRAVHFNPLVAVWKEYGIESIEVLPEETHEDKTYHVLQTSEQADIKYYLDKQNHLLARMSAPVEFVGLPFDECVSHFEDYASNDGALLPGAWTLIYGEGAAVQKFTVNESKINEDLDDSLFEKPNG